jgi:hypothetical protein
VSNLRDVGARRRRCRRQPPSWVAAALLLPERVSNARAVWIRSKGGGAASAPLTGSEAHAGVLGRPDRARGERALLSIRTVRFVRTLERRRSQPDLDVLSAAQALEPLGSGVHEQLCLNLRGELALRSLESRKARVAPLAQ